MFSCFHNVELLLEPSFGQLEVKETTLSMLLSSVVRMLGLHPRGHWFKSNRSNILPHSSKAEHLTVNQKVVVSESTVAAILAYLLMVRKLL